MFIVRDLFSFERMNKQAASSFIHLLYAGVYIRSAGGKLGLGGQSQDSAISVQ